MKVKNIMTTLLGVTMGAVTGAAVMAKGKEKVIAERKKMSDKHFDLFMLMNQWVTLKQQQKELKKYFIDNGYKEIAIYGMSYVGERLYDELKKSEIIVKYAIDSRAENIYADMEIYTLEDELPKADVIVVTAISFFDEIEESLRNVTDIPVISMEDIVYSL